MQDFLPTSDTFLIGEPVDKGSFNLLTDDDTTYNFNELFGFNGFGFVPQGHAVINTNGSITGVTHPVYPTNHIYLVNTTLIRAYPILGINGHDIADENFRIRPDLVKPLCLLMRSYKLPLVIFLQVDLDGSDEKDQLGRKIAKRLIFGNSTTKSVPASRGFDGEAVEQGFSDCKVSNVIYSKILSWETLIMAAKKHKYYLPTSIFYGRLYDGTLPGLITYNENIEMLHRHIPSGV